jgi:Zn-dependent protease with chaperone function
MSPHPATLFSSLHVAGDFPLSSLVRFTFGGPIHNLWPVLVVPVLAALASDRAARALPRAPASAAAALALALAPGVLALCLIVNSWLYIEAFKTWRGFVLYRVTPAASLVIVGWAALRLWRRQAAVAQLFRISRAAGPRLTAIAGDLRVRELPTPAPECFVAGVLRPTAFVSTGALARLDDEELAAALAHERAHVAGADPRTLAVLALLSDLVPFRSGVAGERFLAAREARADGVAARAVGALPLASALVALARPVPRTKTVLLMAAAETLAWRMDALLSASRARPAVPAGVWAPLAFLVWPVAQRALLSMFCG